MTFYPFPSDLDAFGPDDRTGRNDRLVKRFATGHRLHIHLRLGERPNPNNRSISAEVINVSIAGASLRVTGTLRVNPGAMVTLGNGASTATCRVVYAGPASDDRGQILGLEFVRQSDPFRLDVGLVIAALRKDHGQVIRAWHRAN